MQSAVEMSSSTSTIRVIIADDHAVVRDGLRAIVDAQLGLRVVGEACDGEEACLRARELQPDVVVLDLSMPNVGGTEAAHRITSELPHVKVLALTMHEERGYVARLLRAGASGYLLKRTASSELVRAIRVVAAGDRYIDPSIGTTGLGEQTTRARPGDATASTSTRGVTARELEVLRLLALGHSNKEISGALAISVKTVESHRASGMAKLGVGNRASLVRFALAEGWLRDQ